MLVKEAPESVWHLGDLELYTIQLTFTFSVQRICNFIEVEVRLAAIKLIKAHKQPSSNIDSAASIIYKKSNICAWRY